MRGLFGSFGLTSRFWSLHLPNFLSDLALWLTPSRFSVGRYYWLNFGLITFDWDAREAFFEVRNVHNDVVMSFEYSFGDMATVPREELDTTGCFEAPGLEVHTWFLRLVMAFIILIVSPVVFVRRLLMLTRRHMYMKRKPE